MGTSRFPINICWSRTCPMISGRSGWCRRLLLRRSVPQQKRKSTELLDAHDSGTDLDFYGEGLLRPCAFPRPPVMQFDFSGSRRDCLEAPDVNATASGCASVRSTLFLEQFAARSGVLHGGPAITGRARFRQCDAELFADARGNDFAVEVLIVLHGARVFLARRTFQASA